MAARFSFRDEAGAALSDVARLDTMVTVVDAANLLADYSSLDFLRDRGEARDTDDERTLVDLLVEQIEFADVVIINKVSDVDAGDAAPASAGSSPRSIPMRASSRPISAMCRLAAILDTGCSTRRRRRDIRCGTRNSTASATICRRRKSMAFRVSSIAPGGPSIPRDSMSSYKRDGPDSSAPKAISGWRRAPNGSASFRRRPARRVEPRRDNGGRRSERVLAAQPAVPGAARPALDDRLGRSAAGTRLHWHGSCRRRNPRGAGRIA